MRWSSLVVVGLSGTSLALAAGCSKNEDSGEKQAKVEIVAEQATDDMSAWVRRSIDRRDREARRQAERPEAPSSGPAPWFLRPAGDTTQTSAQNPSPSETNPLVKSEPPKPLIA